MRRNEPGRQQRGKRADRVAADGLGEDSSAEPTRRIPKKTRMTVGGAPHRRPTTALRRGLARQVARESIGDTLIQPAKTHEEHAARSEHRGQGCREGREEGREVVGAARTGR